MYVYYFERILRAAVQQAVGDPNYEFTLPFWDYGDAAYHDLPEPFRVPAASSNSLYIPQRASNCNNGQECVSASTGSSTQAMSLLPFCNCPQGQSCTGCTANLLPDEAFGSQFTSAPVHLASYFGELESQPHNVVHDAVGGDSGWMAYVECAARDPIFWIHHANIDRLWQVWLNQGDRQNPLGADNWKQQVFTFFDENQHPVTMTGCQVLNMATQLDYQYAGLPVQNVQLCSEAVAEAAPVARAPAPTEAKVLTATTPSEMKLSNAPLSVNLPLPAGGSERMLNLVSKPVPGTLRVVIEGLKRVHPGAFYQVFLNQPEGQAPDPASPHFLGNIALFGSDHHGGGGEVTRTFDISAAVRALRDKGQWTGQLRLTFVRGNPPPEKLTADQQSRTYITFSRISVIER
jgi:tyrosinase